MAFGEISAALAWGALASVGLLIGAVAGAFAGVWRGSPSGHDC